MKLHYQKLSDLIGDDYANTGTVPTWVWASGHRLLTPWIKDRINFAFNDPASFGNTPVNPTVFLALLENLTNPDGLTDKGLVKLVERFSAACMKEEWHDFYQPILQRKTDHGLTMGQFNHDVYDTHWVVVPFKEQPIAIGNPTEQGFYYSYNDDWHTVYIIIHEDYVETVDRQFAAVSYEDVAEACQVLCGDKDVSYPLVIETICEGYELQCIDAFEIDKINVWPAVVRRLVLEQCFMKVTEDQDCNMIVLGEGIQGDESSIDEVLSLFTELGNTRLTQLLFKPLNKTFADPVLLVPSHVINLE
jgi:hypothetical protein